MAESDRRTQANFRKEDNLCDAGRQVGTQNLFRAGPKKRIWS